MDWLSFIASLAKSLAWPTAVLLLVLLLRRQVGPALARLLDRATRLKAPGGIEFEFGRELGKAREKNEALEIEAARSASPQRSLTKPAVSPAEPDDHYIALAKLSPEAAILDAFKQVERVLVENQHMLDANYQGPTGGRHATLDQLVHELSAFQAVSGEVVDQFQRVRRLRNLAAHTTGATDLSVAAALEYQELCRVLANALELGFARIAVLREPETSPQ
jgi:hypothetical protein